jgi:DNA polymerase III sliding clamp (beta) subunit (PCNA family)
MQAVLDLIDSLHILLEKIRVTVEPRINIEVKPHALKDAIAICKKAISDRPTHPVLANFLLTAKYGKITLTASNLQTFIELQLDGEIIQDGSICVPVLLIEKIVNAITKNTTKKQSFYYINLSENSQEITDRYGNKEDQPVLDISYKSSKQVISCMSADEFPATPDIVGKIHNIPDLVKIFNQLKPHCSRDDLRNTLTGVNIGKGRAIASDGCSVAIKKIDSSTEVIIPAMTRTATEKHWLEYFENPNFIIGDDGLRGFIKFFENGITVTQRMLEGRNYATDWDTAIPETVAAVITKNELSSIYKELEIFDFCAQTDGVKSDKQCIWLEFKPGKITASSFTLFLENSYKLDCDSRIDKTIYVHRKQLASLIETAFESPNQDIHICTDGGLIAIKQDDLLLGFMPLPIINSNNVVVASGCGYGRSIDLPYRYDIENKCLTVGDNMINCGYAIAEYIGYNPSQKVAQIKKEAEEKAAWDECISQEPQELIIAACEHKLTEKLLKDRYKSLAAFKSSKFGNKEKSWSEAVRSYTFTVTRWHKV